MELPALAVFRLGDEFFVTDDTCTHGDAFLSDGEVSSRAVERFFVRSNS